MKRSCKPKVRGDDRAAIVKQLAASGLSGDVIAAALNLGKNRLRETFAIDLHAGRESKRVAEAAARAAEPTKEEAARLARIKQSFESDWFSETYGNDIFGGAKNIAEALQWCDNFRSARVPNEDSNGSND